MPVPSSPAMLKSVTSPVNPVPSPTNEPVNEPVNGVVVVLNCNELDTIPAGNCADPDIVPAGKIADTSPVVTVPTVVIAD